MACNGGSIIASVLQHLKLEDVQLLLENRGMPSIGGKEELTERLQVTLPGLRAPYSGDTTSQTIKNRVTRLLKHIAVQAVLSEEICDFEWEQGEVPGCHTG